MSRLDDAYLHLDWARKAREQNNFFRARSEYLKATESVRQINGEGKYNADFEAITSEYHNFVKDDPFFHDLLKHVLPLIEANPGVLQADIPKRLPELSKIDISYVLYFADLFGKISRTKKGRTYELKIVI